MDDKNKLQESDYLKRYKCNYCDGTHCTVCTLAKHKKNNDSKNNSTLLYEEPRVK